MPSIADVFVTVLPETSQIASRVKNAFRAVDDDALEAGKRWGRKIEAGLGTIKVNIDADVTPARTAFEHLERWITSHPITVKVDADTTAAKLEVQRLKDSITDLRVKIDLDWSPARLSFARLERHVTFSPLRAKLDLDTSPARATYRLLQAWIRANPLIAHVDISTRSFTLISTSIMSAVTSGIQSASAAAPQMGGSMGSSMGGAMAITLGATLLAGLASSLSGLAGLIPAALMGAGTTVGALAIGLNGIGDAYTAVSDAAKDSGTESVAQARAVTSAQQALRNAVEDEADAQKGVADARRDARQELEDYNLELRGGVLDETEAVLQAKKAREDLANGTFKSATDYQMAQLRVLQADQRVAKSRDRNVELQQKAADAQAKGVEGSDKVVQANQRLVRSQEQVANAQQAVDDAQNKTGTSAQKAADALAELSPMGREVVNTLYALKPAFDALKFAVSDKLLAGVSGEIKQLADVYLPVLQTGLGQMAGVLNQAFMGLSGLFQQPEMVASMQTLFTNLATSFQAFLPVINEFVAGFIQMSTVGSGFLPQLADIIGKVATSFNEWTQSGKLEQWIQVGLDSLDGLIPIVGLLGDAFLSLAPIGQALLPVMQQFFETLKPMWGPLAQGIASFITALGPVLNIAAQMMTTWAEVFPQLWTTAGPAITDLMQVIADEFIPVLRDDLTPILSETAKIFANGLADAIREITPHVGDIVRALGGWFKTMVPLLPKLMDMAVAALPGMIDSLVSLLPHVVTFLEKMTLAAEVVLPPVLKMVEALGTTFSSAWELASSAVEKAWNVIKPVIDKMMPVLNPVLAAMDYLFDTAGSVGPGKVAGSVPKGGSGTSSIPGVWAPPFSDKNLQPNAAKLNDLVAAQFPQIKEIGGYRQDKHPDHPSGLALDIMIPGGTTRGGANPQGKILGDQIWAWLNANAAELGFDPQGSLWQTDTGGDHYDHIHALTLPPGQTPALPAAVQPTAPATPIPALTSPALTGGLGANPSQQDVANYIISTALAKGYTQAEAEAFVVQAFGESGLRPGAYGASTGDASGGASGVFQFTPGTWKDFGQGDPMNAQANIDAYFRLAAARDPKSGDIKSRLAAISGGGPAHPNNTGHWDKAMSGAQPFLDNASGPSGPLGTAGDPMYVSLSPNVPAGQKQGMNGEQFGQDMFNGILQLFGLDGSIFGEPTGFGIFDVIGSLSKLGGTPRGGDGASQPYITGGGGGIVSGLQGILPQPFGDLNVGSPGDAPGQFMPSVPGSRPGGLVFNPNAAAGGPGPGNQVDQSIHFSGNNFGHSPTAVQDQIRSGQLQVARQPLRALPTP